MRRLRVVLIVLLVIGVLAGGAAFAVNRMIEEGGRAMREASQPEDIQTVEEAETVDDGLTVEYRGKTLPLQRERGLHRGHGLRPPPGRLRDGQGRPGRRHHGGGAGHEHRPHARHRRAARHDGRRRRERGRRVHRPGQDADRAGLQLRRRLRVERAERGARRLARALQHAHELLSGAQHGGRRAHKRRRGRGHPHAARHDAPTPGSTRAPR